MEIFGNFNYDRTPMDPTVIKVILHEHPKYRGLWSPHVLSGWYIGPSLEYFHCHKVWITATTSVRIGQNVSWSTHKPIIPTATNPNIIIATNKYLTEALK